ncbi:MAG: DMT family transporter, partial [Clostridiales bacterium]
QSSTVGNLLTISEGIFFAAITYSAQKIGKDNPMGVTAVANLATALIIFAFLPPKLTDLATIPLSVWPIMLFLGIFMVGCGYSLFNIGNKYLSPQNASLMALWELLLGPIWVAIFLKEYPSAIVVCGLAVILCGLTANAFIEKQLKLQLEV